MPSNRSTDCMCARARTCPCAGFCHTHAGPPPQRRHLGGTPRTRRDRPQPTARGGMEPTSPGPCFPQWPVPCAAPRPPTHPQCRPLHVPATPTLCAPAHASSQAPRDQPFLSQRAARPVFLPPALPTPPWLLGLLTCPSPGQASPLPLLLWGSWAGCGRPALLQQSDPVHLHWVVGPSVSRTAGPPLPTPTRRRKPSSSSWKRHRTFSKLISSLLSCPEAADRGYILMARQEWGYWRTSISSFLGTGPAGKKKRKKTIPGRLGLYDSQDGAQLPGAQAQASRSLHQAALVVLEATRNTPAPDFFFQHLQPAGTHAITPGLVSPHES